MEASPNGGYNTAVLAVEVQRALKATMTHVRHAATTRAPPNAAGDKQDEQDEQDEEGE